MEKRGNHVPDDEKLQALGTHKVHADDEWSHAAHSNHVSFDGHELVCTPEYTWKRDTDNSSHANKYVKQWGSTMTMTQQETH
jgi:hypothetical protein